jgi:hypothetical protein
MGSKTEIATDRTDEHGSEERIFCYFLIKSVLIREIRGCLRRPDGGRKTPVSSVKSLIGGSA